MLVVLRMRVRWAECGVGVVMRLALRHLEARFSCCCRMVLPVRGGRSQAGWCPQELEADRKPRDKCLLFLPASYSLSMVPPIGQGTADKAEMQSPAPASQSIKRWIWREETIAQDVCDIEIWCAWDYRAWLYKNALFFAHVIAWQRMEVLVN